MEDEALPVPEELRDSVDRKVFRKARVVSAAEVASFLTQHTSEMRKTNASYEAHPETTKALDYCTKFSSTQSADVLAKLRETISNRLVTEYHLGMILNLLPESVEELKALIPALDPALGSSPFIGDEDIQAMLDDLATYKQVDFS